MAQNPEPVTLSGVTSLRRRQGGDVAAVVHGTHMRIAHDRADLFVEHAGSGTVEHLTSTNRAVLYVFQEYDNMIAREMYRNRSVVPLFKVPTKRRSVVEPTIPDGYERCPICLNLAEAVVDCLHCDGDGIVAVDYEDHSSNAGS